MNNSISSVLPEDFDPWYVLLSPPENIKSHDASFLVKPKMETAYVKIDYEKIKKEAESAAKNLIRERWKEIRSLTPVEKTLGYFLQSRFVMVIV